MCHPGHWRLHPMGRTMSRTTRTGIASGRDADWRWIRTMFPLHLNALARQTNAVCFWRAMPSAQVLLRMLLLWGLCGFGLRSVAAWGMRAGWANLTDDSLRYRFRQCEDFLHKVLSHVLDQWVNIEPCEGVPLRLVDATMLAVPGPTGRTFRLHAVFDPRRKVLTSVQLTDNKQAESITRGPHVAGDLAIADRGLARAKSLLELSARNVWWIVRAHLGNLKMWDAHGRRLDQLDDELCAAADAAKGPVEWEVFLRHEGRVQAARLIVLALPPKRAEAARHKLTRRSQRKRSKPPHERTLRLAGYVMLLTTLPPEKASAAAVLQWYRVRWQIELFFKRCKSLLKLQTIVSASDELQRVRLLTSMLIAALVDRMNVPAIDSENAVPPSLWRWTQTHQLVLLRAVSGEDAPMHVAPARAAQVARLLRDRPRKRHATHSARTIATRTYGLNSRGRAIA